MQSILRDVLLVLVGGIYGYLLANEHRLSKLEERMRGFGQSLRYVPKRRTDWPEHNETRE